MELVRKFRFGRKAMVWLAVSLLGLFVIFCGAVLLRPSIRARYLFGQLETLEIEHSTFGDAERLARKIGAETINGPCDRSSCEWMATADNSRLPRWWRGAGETFAVSFTVKNSIVVRKVTSFGIGAILYEFHPSVVSLDERRHWEEWERMREPVKTGWGSTDLYRYYQFGVRMTPEASAEDRRRYTNFDYGCFWKFRGCRDARDLLPTADPFPDDRVSVQQSR
jgi:hypothetical protein